MRVGGAGPNEELVPMSHPGGGRVKEEVTNECIISLYHKTKKLQLIIYYCKRFLRVPLLFLLPHSSPLHLLFLTFLLLLVVVVVVAFSFFCLSDMGLATNS